MKKFFALFLLILTISNIILARRDRKDANNIRKTYERYLIIKKIDKLYLDLIKKIIINILIVILVILVITTYGIETLVIFSDIHVIILFVFSSVTLFFFFMLLIKYHKTKTNKHLLYLIITTIIQLFLFFLFIGPAIVSAYLV